MRWLRKLLPWRHRELWTPDAPSTDLSDAQAARARAERAIETGQARRSRVDNIVRRLEEIRRRNHLAEAVERLFEGR